MQDFSPPEDFKANNSILPKAPRKPKVDEPRFDVPAAGPIHQESREGKSKKPVLITAGVALLVALGAGGFMLSGVGSASSSIESAIPAMIPEDADTVVVAPSSQEWWKSVTSMAPMGFNLTEVDIYSSDLQVENIGYSRTVDTVERELMFTGPLRTFYLESPNEEEAKRVQEFLSEKLVGANAVVLREGAVVSVNHSWVDEFSIPEESIEKRSEFTAAQESNDGVMLIDFDNMASSLAGVSNEDRKSRIISYFEKGFGFKPETAWVGTSGDGITWEGEYTSGGYDDSLRDVEGLEATLAETEEVLAEGVEKSEDSETKVIISDPQMSGMLSEMGFYQKSTAKRSGMGTDAMDADVKSVDDEKLEAIMTFSSWNAAASGISSFVEGVDSMLFSIGDKTMNIAIRYS